MEELIRKAYKKDIISLLQTAREDGFEGEEFEKIAKYFGEVSISQCFEVSTGSPTAQIFLDLFHVAGFDYAWAGPSDFLSRYVSVIWLVNGTKDWRLFRIICGDPLKSSWFIFKADGSCPRGI